MAEYIDMNAVEDAVENSCADYYSDMVSRFVNFEQHMHRQIVNILYKRSADVVEVVRCRDCKYFGEDSWCDYVDDKNFFCARGERRETDD